MAAGTWKVFNKAKYKIGMGAISLSSTLFKLALFTSATNLKSSGSALLRSTYASLTNEVANAAKYVTGGFNLTGENWSTGRSAKEYAFYTSNLTFTASGGTINDIKFAAIYLSGGPLLCYVTLTTGTGGFDLADGNTCTIQCPANGVLMLY